MAKKDKTSQNQSGLTRRDFLKVAGVAGATGGLASAIDWVAVGPNPALAATVTNNYDIVTTCPYCSVGCNMRVGINHNANPEIPDKVVDIIGDPDCPINKGALCSKGAAAIQLANNNRRVGYPGVRNAVPALAASDPETGNPGPLVRTGNGPWTAVSWDDAMAQIAGAMVSARQATSGWITGGKVTGSAKGVAFLGCSHATNEENWLYRKMIADFGTNNVEHQARI